MTTREQALDRVLEIVHKGYRHQWHERTLELSKLYRALVTGDGLDELLKQFVQRESDDDFAQRKALTTHIATTVTSNIMDVFYKVPRSNYQRILEHIGENGESKTIELEAKLAAFWGKKDLDTYMKSRWLKINATDPNAFIVVEFKPFDHTVERASPYPWEVTSEQAVDFEYQNNVLQHLAVQTHFKLALKDGKETTADKYTIYLADETFTLTEVDPLKAPSTLRDGEWSQDGYLLSKKRVYLLEFSAPHNAGYVPAICAGYSPDAWTNGTTYVAPYHSAVPLMIKSLKINSELDITMSQQVFPHRAQYMPRCKAEGCLSGTTANGDECPSCRGTGYASITSAQQVMYINLPKAGDPLWDLEKLLVFKGPPIDVVKFQSEYLDKLTAGCKAAVFNSESFTNTQIQETATGKNLDRDNIQDTLYTCAIGFADSWQFLVTTSATFTDLDKGLMAKVVFSKDFKLKGLTELIADLESAKRSESGPSVIQHIQRSIAMLMYAEDPAQLAKWKAQEKFNPFSGYSNDMISMALTDPNVPQRYKVRYLMMGVMFNEIEQKYPDFYKKNEVEQTRIVEEQVAAYASEAEPAKPVLVAPSMN